MAIDKVEYITFSRSGARFAVPTNPGPYPASVDTNKVIRESQIAEHKTECIEYETYLGVENYLCRMIVKSINHEWLTEVESETMGFNHLFGTLQDGYVCNVPLPRVPREQRISPALTAPKARIDYLVTHYYQHGFPRYPR
jgi:hypothetical protein